MEILEKLLERKGMWRTNYSPPSSLSTTITAATTAATKKETTRKERTKNATKRRGTKENSLYTMIEELTRKGVLSQNLSDPSTEYISHISSPLSCSSSSSPLFSTRMSWKDVT